MRLLNISALCFTIASALFLYGLSYESRRIEARVQAEERAAEQAKSDIAILKAERSHLSRPERIDALARQFRLGPPLPDQLSGPHLASAVPDHKSEALSRHLAEGK